MKVIYKIKSTGFNSSKYGNCELCKKECSEVFIGSTQMVLSDHIMQWKDCFGHKECLETHYAKMKYIDKRVIKGPISSKIKYIKA